MIRKFRKTLRTLRSQLFVDVGNYRRTVLLAGTGRSGTTWLQEIIAHTNAYRVMFEPFHSKKVDLVSGWNYRQYLRCNDRSDRFVKPATAILSGNIRHEWIDNFNRTSFSRKRLIKDIRAQLFLNWLKHNFPEIPIVLLLRHPCAVAHSQMQLGWGTHLDDFLVQEDLMHDFLDPFKKEIEGARDVFDKHVLMWCIENYVPLKQFSEGEILVVFYENLCTSPQQEIEAIFSFIGESVTPKVFEMSARPSALCRKHSAILSGADPLNSWRMNVSDKQTKRAVEICSMFGLHAIYDESTLPLLTGKEALNVLS